ncbi:ABC transporter substrate-binding protein [Duganella sp. HH101]|uniref:substrate-binding periplasmic protein n=1 Tax=Duganella sp. HH101 TaxID=1781066 RepID=UPI001E3D5929|nr:ABC transporter substrate-binding protein [Duganella sp. HH101]
MERRTLLGAAMALGCSAGLTRAAPVAQLRVVTAHLPPLVIENGGNRPGALRELVDELCNRVQMALKLEFVPWKRALFLATSMPATAIFPVTRLPEREATFRWLAPLYEEHYLFLAAHNSKFDIEHPGDMKGRRIALMRGAAQAAILQELGYRNIIEANSIEEVHRYLTGGMADAAFGERNIILSSLSSRSAQKDFRLSPPVRSTTAWLAGSLDFDDATVQQFQRAKAAMDADGTSRRILARYKLA